MLHWYDFETSSANHSTQVLQFASVTTDQDLNVLPNSTNNYLSIPRRDIIPSPIAFMIHMLDIDHLKEHGYEERDLDKKIQNQFMYSDGSQMCGFNTIKFDDNVFRHSLFRNCLPAYDHEWKNGNSRFDAFKLVQLVYALRPEILQFLKKDDGSDSLKLEALCKANGIVHERAHDALSDVYASIGLARLIKERNPRLYDHAQNLTGKGFNDSMALSGEALLHVNFGYKQSNRNSSVILPLVKDLSNKNKYLAVDLREDPYNLINMSSDEIRHYLFTKRVDLPDDAPRVPVSHFQINDMPLIIRATPGLMTQNLCDQNNFNLDDMQKHKEMILSSRDIKTRIQNAFKNDGKGKAPGHVFDTLYSGGFFSRPDEGFRAEVAIKTQKGIDESDMVSLASKRDDKTRMLEILVSMKSIESMSLIEKAVLYRQLNFSFNDIQSNMTFDSFNQCVSEIRISKDLSEEQEIVLEKLISHVEGLKHNFLELQNEMEEKRHQIDADISATGEAWLVNYMRSELPNGVMPEVPFKRQFDSPSP